MWWWRAQAVHKPDPPQIDGDTNHPHLIQLTFQSNIDPNLASRQANQHRKCSCPPSSGHLHKEFTSEMAETSNHTTSASLHLTRTIKKNKKRLAAFPGPSAFRQLRQESVFR